MTPLGPSASPTTGNAIPVAVETNGKGYTCFLVDLPGAFTRGRSESEVLSKVPAEARSYLDWLGVPSPALGEAKVVEWHVCQLMVEDADGEILLTADRGPFGPEEFEHVTSIVRLSGETFFALYDSSSFKDWVDPSRLRKTFYGEAPNTIREVFHHVENTQRYYLSRVGLDIGGNESFLEARGSGLRRIGKLFEVEGNSKVYEVDGESWTVKKVLRRFIWHDRIHGKSITRILAKQKQLGLIKKYEDTFRFNLGT
jgi:hypothetical protein